jgi:hypothetical protein
MIKKVSSAPGDNTERIVLLKLKLATTDFQIIKCAEFSLLGQELPYDLAALHAERQAIRNQINLLESGVE